MTGDVASVRLKDRKVMLLLLEAAQDAVEKSRTQIVSLGNRVQEQGNASESRSLRYRVAQFDNPVAGRSASHFFAILLRRPSLSTEHLRRKS